MKDVTLIGVDLAKRVFHLHGAAVDGSVVFRKKLSRVQFEHFVKCHPGCVVAMEACGSAFTSDNAICCSEIPDAAGPSHGISLARHAGPATHATD